MTINLGKVKRQSFCFQLLVKRLLKIMFPGLTFIPAFSIEVLSGPQLNKVDHKQNTGDAFNWGGREWSYILLLKKLKFVMEAPRNQEKMQRSPQEVCVEFPVGMWQTVSHLQKESLLRKLLPLRSWKINGDRDC